MTTWLPIDHLTARWRPTEGVGLEHLVVEANREGYLVKSHVVGENGGIRDAFSYEIHINLEWRVLSFKVESIEGRKLACTSPALGIWHDLKGSHLKELDGCVDIDFSFTCFTNTLPVRRMSFHNAQVLSFRMLYVSFDTLDPLVDGQRYTCLKLGRCFLYESIDGSFTREIEFDDYGLVQSYPGLYQRVD
jgi:uncharacterized protein